MDEADRPIGGNAGQALGILAGQQLQYGLALGAQRVDERQQRRVVGPGSDDDGRRRVPVASQLDEFPQVERKAGSRAAAPEGGADSVLDRKSVV